VKKNPLLTSSLYVAKLTVIQAKGESQYENDFCTNTK